MPYEFGIRKLLWLTHSCGQSYLYGDDGEMQCHLCGLDFVRHREQQIVSTFDKVGMMRFYVEIGVATQEEFDSSMAVIRLNNLMGISDVDRR
jgi:hypothetical protein